MRLSERKIASRLLLSILLIGTVLTLINFLVSIAAAQTAQQLVNLAVSNVEYNPIDDEDSAVLVVKTGDISSIIIEYGISSGKCSGAYANSVGSNDHERHEVLLDGLNSASSVSTTVCYRVKDAITGTILAEDSFNTAQRPGESFSFGVTGDTMPWEYEMTSTSDGWSTISTQMAAENLDLAVVVGDLIHNFWNESNAATVEAKYNGFFAASMNFTGSFPLYTAVGNHEQVYIPVCRDVYEREFTLPENDGEAASQYGEHYYSFDNGDTHFISLSTEIPGEEGLIIGDQLQWLEQDLAADNKPWTVVFFHRPLFYTPEMEMTIGPYERWFDLSDPLGPENRQHLRELFSQAGVDFIFEGHAHWYHHQVEDGVNYIITGTGGSYIPAFTDPELGEGDLFFKQGFGHVKVDETPESMILTVIDTNGAKYERFELFRDGSYSLDIDSGEAPVISGILPAGIVNTASTQVSAVFSDASVSSGIDSSSAKLSVSEADVSGCVASEAGITCSVSNLETGDHTIEVLVSDNSGNTSSAFESFNVMPCQPARPNLALSLSDVFWASNADYNSGNLSLRYDVSNLDAEPSNSVEIISATATNGVICASCATYLGTVYGGATQTATLLYNVPQGVSRFNTTVHALACDCSGNAHDYPV